jgi:DNA-binding transcriptional ArsR family regulator
MLRIRLSAEDLSRVRFAISPINQAVINASQTPAQAVRSADSASGFSGVGTRESAASLVMRLLATKPGDRPDFLTPAPPVADSDDDLDLDAELEAVRATPASLIAKEMTDYHFDPRLRDLQALADGDDRAKNHIANGLHHIHHTTFGRDWNDAKALLRADITRRTNEMGRRGIDHVLSTLHPRLSYHHGVLTVHSPRDSSDIIANGHGLILVPTIIPTRSLAIKTNPRDPVVLIYPIGDRRPFGSAAQSVRSIERRLGRVVGQSRASIMLTLLSYPNLCTSQLAERCGIATSSASEHATVLRDAGLVESYRMRNRMLHSLTSLGIHLVYGHPSMPN